MNEFRSWLPIIILAVSNVVVVTLSYASLKEKIAVLDTKLKSIDDQVGEIKENHLQHLSQNIDKLSDKLTEHIINTK